MATSKWSESVPRDDSDGLGTLDSSMSSEQGEYLQFGGMAVPEGVMMRSPNYYAVACRAPNDEIIVKTEPLEKTWIGKLTFLKKPFLRGSLALLDTMGLGLRAMNFASDVQLNEKYVKEEDLEKVRAENAQMAVATPKEFLTLGIISLLLVALAAYLWPNLEPFVSRSAGFDMNRMLWPAVAAVFAVCMVIGTVFWKPIKWHLANNEKLAIGVAVVFSLGFGFLIFKAAPEAVAQMILQSKDEGGTSTNYAAELIKIVLFIGYLMLIRRLPAILDTFRYHGAEHKAINTIEAKEELTTENCMAQTRLHPRCGTNFAIVVLLVGLLLFPLIPRYPILFGYEIRGAAAVVFRVFLELIVFMPIIAGISYEIIRAAGKMKNQKWVEVLLKPGLATQLITTEEPEEKHIEVAMRSLNAVLKAEATGELENSELLDGALRADAGAS
ncbi:DUF1385 domain-containing protein [Kamptonema cortianum]|nr:DUF1385 domain-containing protein [Geitlerinema splendidum]MDK3156335.1 DUF1385 domain-containing protein [Kamptonema cortianum]